MNKSDLEGIGTRIRLEREKLNLSREKLSQLIGISAYHIGQIERGERNMSVGTLLELARVLRVSLDYIIFGYNRSKKESENEDFVIKETNETEIDNLLLKCTKEEVGLITEIIKLILPHLRSSY